MFEKLFGSKRQEPCRPNAVRPNAKKIKQLRINKGWDQIRFADVADCGKRTIENIEQGKCCFLVTIAALAKALGLATEELIIAEDKIPADDKNRQSCTAELPDYKKVLANPLKDSANAVEVSITFRTSHDEFDETEYLTRVVTNMIVTLATGNNIRVLKIEKGAAADTTVVSVAVAIADVEYLMHRIAKWIKGRYADPNNEEGFNETSMPPSTRPNPYFGLISEMTVANDMALSAALRGKSLSSFLDEV